MQNSVPLIVCLTGHRQIPIEHALRLPALLEKYMLDLIEQGAVEFRAGGALGFDMVAALKLLEIKEKMPHIKLHLCLPCRDQAKGWNDAAVRAYHYILDRADEVTYTTDYYVPGCMLARDRELVEGSDVCLAYCTQSHGGAVYTCNYAKKQGLDVINVADELPPI